MKRILSTPEELCSLKENLLLQLIDNEINDYKVYLKHLLYFHIHDTMHKQFFRKITKHTLHTIQSLFSILLHSNTTTENMNISEDAIPKTSLDIIKQLHDRLKCRSDNIQYVLKHAMPQPKFYDNTFSKTKGEVSTQSIGNNKSDTCDHIQKQYSLNILLNKDEHSMFSTLYMNNVFDNIQKEHKHLLQEVKEMQQLYTKFISNSST